MKKTSKSNSYPLHDAYITKNGEEAKKLLEKGADVHKLNNDGMTPTGILSQYHTGSDDEKRFARSIEKYFMLKRVKGFCVIAKTLSKDQLVIFQDMSRTCLNASLCDS